MSGTTACNRSMIYRWWFSSLFSLAYIQRGNEEKAAVSRSLSLSLALFLRFSATFLLRFRSLSLLRFAERISLVYSIVKIEMIDFDSILSIFPLLFLSFSLFLFPLAFPIDKKAIISLSPSCSLFFLFNVNSITDMEWDRSHKSTRAEAKFDFDYERKTLTGLMIRRKSSRWVSK